VAKAAPTPQKNKRKKRNIVLPKDFLFTLRAKRSPSKGREIVVEAINNHIKKTTYTKPEKKNN